MLVQDSYTKIGKLLLFLIWGVSLPPPAFAQPPENTTFTLPTYQDQKPLDFRSEVPPLQTAPSVDNEAVFRAVIACYPSPSRFDISVKLQAGGTLFDEQNSFDGLTERGNYYVGIVAEMPLIDGSQDVERARQWEYERRKETSAQVAKFVSALSKRNQAEREKGLYSALERRARARVKMGVTSVSEQVAYSGEVEHRFW